jgi:hypothetical protein
MTRTPRRTLTLLAALALVDGVGAATVLAAETGGARRWKPELLPREREVEAALAAGPKAIAAGAGVYALEERGFVRVRASANGFHCLVQRSSPGAFEPQCLDDEGARSILPAILLEAELRMSGASDAEVEAGLAAAWVDGRLRAPARPGINYMLSTENRVPADESGTRIIPYRPHVMFYAPYLTNRDLGAEPMGDSPVFVIAEGTPRAYVVVPVPAETIAPHAHPSDR